MTWARCMWLRFQTLFRRRRTSRRLDDEMQFHLDQQIAENVAAGMSPGEARYSALRAFGNPTLLKEQVRDSWGWLWLEQIARNLRQSARALARTPVFALTATLVIALGIGATTALFAVVHSVLLKPLPFKDSGRLLCLYEHSSDDKFPYNEAAGGVFAEWQKQSHGFSGLALLHYGLGYSLSGSGGQLPEKIQAARCSWNLFSVLGVQPALGRTFLVADDQLSANAVVILSWGLWKRRYGGDSSILNQTIHLDAKPYTVVGVMPAWFTYPEQSVQLWTPVYHEEPAEEMRALDWHEFVPIGRLAPGVSPTQATAELSVITRRLHDQHLDDPFISKAANSRPLLEDMVGDVKTPLYVLLAATGCLLLIACLNVASLLVARGAARRKELAIRAALGGGRWRLLGEHLTESFLLAAAAGTMGLFVAHGLIQWFVSARQDMSRVETVRVDGVALVFALGLIFVCALFAGVPSSSLVGTGQILGSLKESSMSHSMSHARVRLRKSLLSLEVGLTVVLLVGAGLLLKSYSRLRSFNLGCITNNVLTMRMTLPEAKYRQPVQRVVFFETLLAQVRALPGVRSASLIQAVPGQGYGGDHGFTIVEHPPLPPGQLQYAIYRWADPQYFESLGVPFIRGRTFDASRRLDRADEVVISSAFVRQYFAGEDPIGKHLIGFGHQPYEIIGVVADTRFNIAEPAEPMMYFPLYSGRTTEVTLAVRSSRDVTSLALPIQKIVQRLDSDLAVSDILTMDQLVGKSALDASFDATLVLAFAVLSLILAAVGLFGVLSYIVAQRTTEIGIRIALGAQRGEVLRTMLWDGVRPAGMGLFLGLAASAAAARMIRSLLYDVQPLDAAVFAGVAVLLAGVAIVACLLPAWRASRLDPVQALRSE